MTGRTSLLAELRTGGLEVVTRLADDTIGAKFMIQPDGDVISQVSDAFLADAEAQTRHLSSIHETLAALRRVERLLHLAVASLGGVTSYLALQEHRVFALTVVFGMIGQLVRGRLRQRTDRLRRHASLHRLHPPRAS
jgi:hypothetical protein